MINLDNPTKVSESAARTIVRIAGGDLHSAPIITTQQVIDQLGLRREERSALGLSITKIAEDALMDDILAPDSHRMLRTSA